MATIGGLTVLRMDGEIPLSGAELEELRRNGIAGSEFRDVSWRAEPASVMTTTLCASASAARTAYLAYYALRGTLVTVVDDNGITHSNVMVRRVRQLGIAPVVGGGSITHILTCAWELQDCSTAY